MVQENRLIVICGPTASGKSDIAIKIAQKLNTEIISADSLAIYKKLDIGTAKPTLEQQKIVRHHLIDCVEPTGLFSVGDYAQNALPIINDLQSRGKIPIVCGGTGYYIKSLLYNLSYGGVGADVSVREKYENILKIKGKEYLYDLLKQVDPESTKKISVNDTMRVIRALEIFDTMGIKKSEIKDDMTPRFDFACFMPLLDRKTLYERIEKRVDKMLESGLVEEVKLLIKQGITLDNQCMQGIGYKETYEAIVKNDFSELADIIKLNTRHYAKRQITFFKRFDNLFYVGSDFENTILNWVNNGKNN